MTPRGEALRPQDFLAPPLLPSVGTRSFGFLARQVPDVRLSGPLARAPPRDWEDSRRPLVPVNTRGKAGALGAASVWTKSSLCFC